MMCNEKIFLEMIARFYLQLSLFNLFAHCCIWWRTIFHEHFSCFLLFFCSVIAALPQQNPKIEGVEKNYYEGDFIFGNCTSDYSYPAPLLAWYINNHRANSTLLQPFQESTIEAYGFKLHQRSLEVRFRIDNRMSTADGKVHMRCESQIHKMPSQVREMSHTFFVSSWDSRNQKLINWKNSGRSLCVDIKCSISYRFIIFNKQWKFYYTTRNENFSSIAFINSCKLLSFFRAFFQVL